MLTSGQDRIFPKDLPVGTVVDFVVDPKAPFMRIRVKPAAHLDRLEEVLVLLTRQELNMKKDTGCRYVTGRLSGCKQASGCYDRAQAGRCNRAQGSGCTSVTGKKAGGGHAIIQAA